MKGEDVWELRIKNVEERDSGLFECQVHTYSFVYWPFQISIGKLICSSYDVPRSAHCL